MHPLFSAASTKKADVEWMQKYSNPAPELSCLTDGLQIRDRSRVSQRHHSLTEQHFITIQDVKQTMILFSNYLQAGGKKTWKNKGTKDFIAFIINLEKLSDREKRGTRKIVQRCKTEDRKFKIPVMESVWRNMMMKRCSWIDCQKTHNKAKNVIWDGLQFWNPFTHFTQF